MKNLTPALLAVAIAVGCVVPAVAAPMHVIVRGARPLLPPPAFDYAYGGDWNDYSGAYGDPSSRYYDPAGATPDWRYHGPLAVDLVLARTLDHTGESMLGHMLTCQAHFATYNPATNAYYGPHGIPVPCYR